MKRLVKSTRSRLCVKVLGTQRPAFGKMALKNEQVALGEENEDSGLALQL